MRTHAVLTPTPTVLSVLHISSFLLMISNVKIRWAPRRQMCQARLCYEDVGMRGRDGYRCHRILTEETADSHTQITHMALSFEKENTTMVMSRLYSTFNFILFPRGPPEPTHISSAYTTYQLHRSNDHIADLSFRIDHDPKNGDAEVIFHMSVPADLCHRKPSACLYQS